MKQLIISNLENPRQLERLYRDNKTSFKKEFNVLYPEIQEKSTAQIWNERLNFDGDDISWGTKQDLIFVIIASFFAGLVAKLPHILNVQEELFYERNIPFIVFPFLTIFFAWKQKLHTSKLFLVSTVFIVSLIYINLLPVNAKSDSLLLACIHLPLFLWAVLGFTFVGGEFGNYSKRINFLQFNGELVIMTGLMVICGALLTGLTLGLFRLINLNIEEFYFNYVVVWGLSAAPIVATYLVRTNPQLVSKVSPVIAKVFTPLVLIMLVIYLTAVIVTGKDPYTDREFLLMFNLLLIGVMAIIFFSIAETSKHSNNRISSVMLLALSIVTVIVNGIALSAILFRISEWGFTPNRLAVLGGNILMLTNLLIVTYKLFRATMYNDETEKVEKSIATFLPVYAVWTIIVVFVFPVMFNFK